jgi:hypothetical protein
MRGLLSLDQELRAARRAKGHKGGPKSKNLPDPSETERPWQPDIDQVHQTMREVLRSVAGLSGVELPGLPGGLQDDDVPPPRLDIQKLKDRFRNDLEGFSIRTTEELMKQAREQTRTALEAVQNEVGGRMDQVAAEFRENSQLPAQIEKLLEPCVEDAEARLEKSISQKFEHLDAQREQLIQDKLQGALAPVHAQITALEQGAQPAEQIERSVEQIVAQATARLEKSLFQKVEQQFGEHERLFQGSLSSVQAQVSTLEQTVQRFRDLKAASVEPPTADRPNATPDVEHLLAEHDRLTQEKLREALSPVRAQIGALEQTVQRMSEVRADSAAPPTAGQPGALADVERRLAEHERVVQDRLQGALNSVQTQITTLEQTVQQIRELKAGSVVKLPGERPVVAADNVMAEYETNLNNGLKGLLDQAFTEIETSFNNIPETPRGQPSQGYIPRPGEYSNSTPYADEEMQRRVEEALDNLGRLGSKNSHPAV